MAEKIFSIVKEYLNHHYLGHLLAAVLVCAAAPLIMGIEALDAFQTAKVLEMYFSVVGIILLVPLFMPDQNKDVYEVICARETPVIYLFLVRLAVAVLTLGMMLLLFLLWMRQRECSFGLGKSWFGTFANCIFLGGIGIFFYGIFENLPAAYMVSVLYYVSNYGSGREYLGNFYMFSMTVTGSMEEKIWLTVGGICLMAAGIFWKYRGRKYLSAGCVSGV